METRWGFVIRTHPFRRLPTTSFTLLVNTLLLFLFPIVFVFLRQRWVIPLPPLQNPAFTNPESFFSRIQTVFIRFSSLEFLGIVVLVMSFSFGHPKMLLVTRTRDSEFYGRDTHPSLSLMAPSPLVGPPFSKINIRFTRPRPCLEKGERCFRPPSFPMGLLAWMFSYFT